MMREARHYLLVGLVAICAAIAASWSMHVYMSKPAEAGGELHRTMHETLALDAQQEARIGRLEDEFAGRRKLLEAQLREANAELAVAIASEHQYGPRVAQAVDRSHEAMGALQKATLSHVFAMRAVLRPDQAARFDSEVVRTLTAPGAQ